MGCVDVVVDIVVCEVDEYVDCVELFDDCCDCVFDCMVVGDVECEE